MGKLESVDFDYSEMSFEEGWELWQKNDGHRGGCGSRGFRGRVIAGPEWSGVWINTQGCGDLGEHIIVPVSKRARAAVRQAVTTKWTRLFGWTTNQAAAMYAAKITYKHELIQLVGAYASARGVAEAAAAFSGVDSDSNSHNRWYARWQECLPPEFGNLSWPRRCAFLECVRVLRGTQSLAETRHDRTQS